jgi:hypothetical protein
MRTEGITPATDGWSQRLRNFVLAHGSSYDPKTGELIHNNETIVVAHKTLLKQSKRFKRESSVPIERTTR